MGPVERALRQDLRNGKTVSRCAAKRRHGVVAITLLDRWVQDGIALRDGDAVAFKLRAIPATTSAVLDERLRTAAFATNGAAEQAQALERARVAGEKRRRLSAEIAGARTDADRRRIVAESRAAAFAEDTLAALGEVDVPPGLGDLFGIELDERAR